MRVTKMLGMDFEHMTMIGLMLQLILLLLLELSASGERMLVSSILVVVHIHTVVGVCVPSEDSDLK